MFNIWALIFQRTRGDVEKVVEEVMASTANQTTQDFCSTDLFVQASSWASALVKLGLGSMLTGPQDQLQIQ